MRALVSAAALSGATLLSSVSARAEEPPAPAEPAAPAPAEPVAASPGTPPAPPAADVAEDPTLRRTVAERRSGVVIGVAGGLGLAGASGYPNSARLYGNPDYYSESPLLGGWSTTFFFMGALTDYVSFGPMLNIARFQSEKWKSTGFGIGFRVEVFPLVRLASISPSLADTSIYGQAGAGATELKAEGNYPSADGTQSFMGIGLHHELRLLRLLGGHVSGGPFVEYDAIFAKTAERHWASGGLRLAWYGGTVAADEPPLPRGDTVRP